MRHLICIIALSTLTITGCKKEAPEQAAGDEAPASAAQPAKSTAPPQAAAPHKTEPPQAGGPQGPAQMKAAMEAMAKAGAAMQGGQVQGKVVNWRKLAPFVPEKIGDYTPTRELKGSTGGMGQMQVTTVKRRYKAGDKKLKVEIVDTSLVPAMRASFAMIQSINEDSSDGVRRGTTVAGQPALLEWRKARQRGKLTIICGGRFLVNISLRPSDDPQEVLKLAASFDLKGLAGLKAE